MKLFHFTSLLHLPEIMRDGLSRGEVPIGPALSRTHLPNAVNLTTDGTAAGNANWNQGNFVDKTRVRLELDLSMNRLTSFRKVRKKHRIRSRWVKLTAPSGEHRHWYFCFGRISASEIHKVQIAFNRPGRYEDVSLDRLPEVLNVIESERATLPIVMTQEGPAFANDPLLLDSWLLDGPFVTSNWPLSPLSLSKRHGDLRKPAQDRQLHLSRRAG